MKFKSPDFLIVGAMKAGTTTLADYLHNNPEITIPKYEVHYFNNESNYKKGIEWYANHFLINERTKIIGEKTPAYSLHKHVPKRVFSLNPNMKLIWILRNPVYRTYSNYLHAVRKGAEINSFEKALKIENIRTHDNYIHDYKKRSLYTSQINTFLSHFPIESMHFIIFEEFIKDPFNTLEKLYHFLGISKSVNLQEKERLQSNKGNLPLSVTLQFYSRKLFGGTIIHNIIDRFNTFYPRKKPTMKKETEKRLFDFFNEENKKLSKLISKDLSLWNS